MLHHQFIRFGSTLSPTVGETFSTDNGHWSQPVSAYVYQWEDCTSVSNGIGQNCSNAVGGPSNPTNTNVYTLVAGDVGFYVDVKITATFASGAQASQVSLATGLVSGGGGSGVPTNSVLPTVTSTTPQISGNIVTAAAGTWANNPTSYNYQWLNCVQANLVYQQCSNATGTASGTGASGSACTNAGSGCSYTMNSADVGDTLAVAVTATNSTGAATASSIQTGMVGPSGGRTFYISFTNGLDSNNGTSTSTAWKHAPNMQGFTGSYTHAAGDRFIFEGGDTWPNSNFPMWANAGTSAQPYYFGVETDWFISANCSGGRFCQPIFDAQNAEICSAGTCTDPNAPGGVAARTDVMMDTSGVNWVTIDDIHFANFRAMLTSSYNLCAVVAALGAGVDNNIIVNRILIDNPTINQTASGALTNPTCAGVLFAGAVPPGSGSSTLENSTLTANGETYGRATQNIPNYINNTMSGWPEGEVYPAAGPSTVAGNNLSYCAVSPSTGLIHDPTDGGAATGGVHGDAIQVQGVGGGSGDKNVYIYDNVIHDTGAATHTECESIITYGSNGEIDWLWNNILYNLGGSSIDIDARGQGLNGIPQAFHAWNNSITTGFNGPGGNGEGQPPYPINSTQPCFKSAGSPASEPVIQIQNNFCVAPAGTQFVQSTIQGTTTYQVDHNISATPAQMNGGIYNGDFTYEPEPTSHGPFVWLPLNASGPITAAGVNLTSNCTGALVSLCRDTIYANGRTATTRPSSGSWDVGAYASQPVNVSAPSVLDTTLINNFEQPDSLVATAGTWTNNPTTYTYQFQDCTGITGTTGTGCSNISTPQCTNVVSTTCSYTLASGDVGDYIVASVTASNAAGPSTPTPSAAQGAVVASRVNTFCNIAAAYNNMITGAHQCGWPDSTNTGFINAPGFNGENTGGAYPVNPTPGALTTAPSTRCPAASSLVSGVPGNPTVYSFCHWTGSVTVPALRLPSGLHDVTFYGSEFTKLGGPTSPENVSGAGSDTHIVFDYDVFEPPTAAAAGDQYPSSPPVACNGSYQYGIYDEGSAITGMTVTHSNFWGFGNALDTNGSSQTQPDIYKYNWIHDSGDPTGSGGCGYHHDGIGPGGNPTTMSFFVIDHNNVQFLGNTNAIAMQNGQYDHGQETNNLMGGDHKTWAPARCDSGCTQATFMTLTGNTFNTFLTMGAGNGNNNNGPLDGTSSPWAGTGDTWANNRWAVAPGAAWGTPSLNGFFWLPLANDTYPNDCHDVGAVDYPTGTAAC